MAKKSDELLVFFKNIGINFKNSKNINTAFTHSSYSSDNYERLEFLGDSVLKLVMSKYLFDKYKTETEGKMTEFRAELVSDRTLTIFAKKLGYDKFVFLGKGEKRTGRSMDTFLACVFEAVLGAIYLEYGNKKTLDIVYDFIFKNFKDEIEKIEDEIDVLNPKAILQEYSQRKFHELPIYNTLEETGLAHEKTFKINVSINGKNYEAAIGKSKKEAQKNAARNAIVELGLIERGGN